MMLNRKKPRLLITCGPTREPIDPVRFISNYSTGTMGFNLAKEALKRKYSVVLISGPALADFSSLKGLKKFISVEKTEDMLKAVEKNFAKVDVVIMAAAISDFRPKKSAGSKIKKENCKNNISLLLIKNPDILLALGKKKKGKILVGFALETDNYIKNAEDKLKSKNLDMVVLNSISKTNTPFGEGLNNYTIISKTGETEEFRLDKKSFSRTLLDKVEALWYTCL